MTATTNSPELTAHLTKRALELELLADGVESGVIDPTLLAPALQLVTIAARRLLESCAKPMALQSSVVHGNDLAACQRPLGRMTASVQRAYPS